MPTSERNVVVRNPNSSRARQTETSVITPLQQARINFETWETPSTNRDDNIDYIQNKMNDGDRIVIASGDGVANQVSNAVLLSDHENITLAMLPLGGFNDIATTFSGQRGSHNPAALFESRAPLSTVKPLDVLADDELINRAILYGTLGWTALAAATMDDPETRNTIQQSRLKKLKMIAVATKLYFDERGEADLPDFTVKGDDSIHSNKSDLVFTNGPTMANVIHSNRRYYEGNTFLNTELDVRKLARNLPFLGTGALNRVTGGRFHLPGDEVETMTANFSSPISNSFQADGEVFELDGVSTIDVRKSDKSLRVVDLLKDRR